MDAPENEILPRGGLPEPVTVNKSSHRPTERRAFDIIALVAGLVLVGACGNDRRADGDSGVAGIAADSAARAEQAFHAQLGREWELAQLGAYQVPPSVPRNPSIPVGDPQPGVRPTIRFASDQPGFGGRSFCNGYGGPYAVQGDSLRMTRIESSAVGCDGPDSLETRFFRGLRETRRFTLDSNVLTLIAGDGSRLVFVPTDTTSSR